MNECTCTLFISSTVKKVVFIISLRCNFYLFIFSANSLPFFAYIILCSRKFHSTLLIYDSEMTNTQNVIYLVMGAWGHLVVIVYLSYIYTIIITDKA